MNKFFAVNSISGLAPLEVHQLYKLRVDVFVHEQQSPYQEIDDIDASDSTFHVLAWQQDDHGDRQLIACTRLYPEITLDGTERFHLGRVCVAENFRGDGMGAEIMKQTLRLAFEQNPSLDIYLEAQTPQIGFYETFGFEVAGAEFDWDGVAHTPMIKRATQFTSISEAA